MTVSELNKDPSYRLLLMLHHEEILPFVEGQFQRKPAAIKVFIGLNIFLLIALGLLAKLDISTGLLSGMAILKYIGLGALIAFTILIPVHEALHGLGYKLCGADHISFGANWRKFYFYAVADQFITGRSAFTFIALLPFLAISILAGAALLFVAVNLKWVLLSILFFHTTACAGDFALLGFFEEHKHDGEMLTYDDVEAKRSYFFSRES